VDGTPRAAAPIGWRDLLLPAALLAVGTAELVSLGTTGWGPSVGLEALAAALLVLRRRWALVVVPAAVLTLTAIPVTGTAMDEASAPILFIVSGIFALGRWPTPRAGLAVLGVLLLLVLAVTAELDPRQENWTDVIFIVALAVPPFVFGRIVRRLDDQNQLVRAQQEVISDQAVRAERDRIARELHDVIAHSVSAMVVQTAAAQDLLRTDPDRAAALLASVADTGRAALAETGRLLHVVRDEGDELGLRPAPGLADLPALVESFRDSGLAVETDLELAGPPLPGGLDVSAYRVVQEALTNALKHGDGSARIGVGRSGATLRITCSNGLGTPAAGNGSRLGLQGMSERVSVLGGRLATDVGEHAFRLEVELPLPAGELS
jgi:signal transduction histidine kinase